uniref:SET domain-containing protein n=1 Tax=Caenorhabditis tropicalis TaxID=1561998 RepID=A0A1I7USZ6_9PELO
MSQPGSSNHSGYMHTIIKQIGRKGFIGELPPFCATEDFDSYLSAKTIEKRQAILKNQSRYEFSEISQNEKFGIAHIKFLRKMVDEGYNKHFRCLEEYLGFYTPPQRRILISKNLTLNQYSPFPAYSDIEGETLDNLRIPPHLTFIYIDRNIINPDKEPLLTMTLDMGNKEENINSFSPILFTHTNDYFWRCIGFSCSSSCSCKGHCSNNTFFMIDRKLFPFEMYRNDPLMGFLLRSPVFIPAGTPLMEFTGEVMDHVRKPNVDYAYQVTIGTDTKLKELVKEQPFTEQYQDLLKRIMNRNFHIDPTYFGNIGRMAGHSCYPNLEVVRVYKRSLSPAHARLIMISMTDIYPGTPLTIDYGKIYEERLSEICRCGSFSCPQGHHEELKNLNFLNVNT